MSEWKSAPSKSNKPKRVYVGNLNNSPDIEEKLRALFSRSSITIQSVEIIPLKKPNTKCYAFVQCDVGMAIKCLNELRFEGNVLNVKPEKTQRKKKGMGFGGGWATPAATPKPFAHCTKSDRKINHSADGISSEQSKLEDGHTSMKDSSTEIMLMNVKKMSLSKGDENPETKLDDISAFRSRCKLSLDSLMGEYGSHDPDYEKMKAMQITSSVESLPAKSRKSDDVQESGMLAPNGKAPVHIEIVSFGFKYSVPPQAREGWSHSNPLSPIDCRDLPRCPHHVSRLSGLSHKVKRTMMNMRAEKNDTENDDDDSYVEEIGEPRTYPLLAKSEEVSKTVVRAVEEAIHEGGHGYAFPLEAKVFLGSEYGRHRSVVLSENVAQKIRAMLRTNEGNRITQPVSVSTRHRDVDQKHKDEEAFGKDLQRKHNAEVKQKKKLEWLEMKATGENRAESYFL